MRLASPWVRYGLIAGIIAFVCTLVANTAVAWLPPADLCRAGPLIVPLLSLGALGIFLLMAVAAGFATGRAGGGSGPNATLAGLLVGVIGGCALVALLPFLPAVEHRFQELSSLCPQPAVLGGGGSFSFNFGPTPPPGVFVIPTPPPKAFATPPPGAFATPSGPGGVLGQMVEMVITIMVGVGLAVGAAALGGLVGAATRPRRDG